jgi:hypothetical protein
VDAPGALSAGWSDSQAQKARASSHLTIAAGRSSALNSGAAPSTWWPGLKQRYWPIVTSVTPR